MDKELLEAIGQMMEAQAEKISVTMDTKLQESERRMMISVDAKFQESERRMMVLMESYFDPKFKALSEQINPVPKEAMDIMEDRVDDLEKTVELHSQQIEELKRAQ